MSGACEDWGVEVGGRRGGTRERGERFGVLRLEAEEDVRSEVWECGALERRRTELMTPIQGHPSRTGVA